MTAGKRPTRKGPALGPRNAMSDALSALVGGDEAEAPRGKARPEKARQEGPDARLTAKVTILLPASDVRWLEDRALDVKRRHGRALGISGLLRPALALLREAEARGLDVGASASGPEPEAELLRRALGVLAGERRR